MVNSDTLKRNADLESILVNVPSDFRKRLVSAYAAVKSAHAERNYDTVGLRAGVFSETMLRFLQNELTGTYIPFGQKINSLSDECKKLMQLPKTSGSESMRLLIPRNLDFSYTLRNKRGGGHAPGEVDPNEIDASTLVRLMDWNMCELIRVSHSSSLEDAQEILDSISSRQLPMIWKALGKIRILATGLNAKDQTMLLLHAAAHGGVLVEDLVQSIEYGRKSDYKRWVLRPLHVARMIEFDSELDVAILSPLGIQYVEDKILPSIR